MKHLLPYLPVTDRRLSEQDHNRARTLWYADGRNLDALVTKVDKDGIHIATASSSGFIGAEELCTSDRVRYGFGTRAEARWVERVAAHSNKQKTAKIPALITKP